MIDRDLPEDFDWQYYLSVNKDLQRDGVTDETAAIEHWLKYGYGEDREYAIKKDTFSLIVACKNRTENLINALPSWLCIDKITEYIIIDYDSDEPLEDNDHFKSWKDNAQIQIVRVVDKEKFNLGQAYNLAIDSCSNHNIIKIDADHACRDDSFLDYFSEPYLQTFFLHGDHIFGNQGLSGFCIFPKSQNVYYREDLNGWGYDDLDFYSRLRQRPHPFEDNRRLKEIIFFDIERYIEHLDHEPVPDKDIIYSNSVICLMNPYLKPLRQDYKLNDQSEIVFTNKKTIDKIYCINLANRTDRWEHCSSIPNVERFDAIKTNENTQKYTEYNLDYNPIDIEVAIYFHIHKGAYGAYLSHYLLWQKIVEENIDNALVLEDDIDANSVEDLLNSNLFIGHYDLIQLSKRVRFDDNNAVFDGAESYIISKEGANTLLSLTHSPFLFNKLGVKKYNNMNYLDTKLDLQANNYRWSERPAITCPVDKFMGYACQTNLLDFFLYPSIDINKSIASNSDIGMSEGINAWHFDQDTILHYSKILGDK
jgi:GR25 family glycosyltransferase involved in LPS biosynthesis